MSDEEVEIAGRIKSRREQLKQRDSRFTQTFVGRKVGAKRDTYASWEGAYNTIPSYMIPRIAKALNVSVGWVLGVESTTIESELVAAWSEIPDFLRPAILYSLQALSSGVKFVKKDDRATEFKIGERSYHLIEV